MAAYRPQSYPFATILTAIKDRLNSELFDSQGFVFVGRQSGTAIPYIAEPFLLLIPSGLILDDSFLGSGIWYTGLKRVINVTIACRTSLDVASETQLDWVATEADNGVLGLSWLEEMVINTLHLTNIQDSNNVNLLNRPMRLIPSNPDFQIDLENAAKDMVFSQLLFEISYGFKTSRAT